MGGWHRRLPALSVLIDGVAIWPPQSAASESARHTARIKIIMKMAGVHAETKRVRGESLKTPVPSFIENFEN